MATRGDRLFLAMKVSIGLLAGGSGIAALIAGCIDGYKEAYVTAWVFATLVVLTGGIYALMPLIDRVTEE